MTPSERGQRSQLGHVLEPCIVRLKKSDDSIAGTGFIIGDGNGKFFVCTCSHVVSEAAGLNSHEALPPTDDVVIDFPFLSGYPRRLGRVAPGGWHPNQPTGDADVALLLLTDGLPTGAIAVSVERAPMGGRPRLIAPWYANGALEFCGFPPGNDWGGFANATTKRHRSANGRVQIESTGPIGYAAQGGFSGAPVWSTSDAGVIGMLAAADPDPRIGYMITAETLVGLIVGGMMFNGPKKVEISGRSAPPNPLLSELAALGPLRKLLPAWGRSLALSVVASISGALGCRLAAGAGADCMRAHLVSVGSAALPSTAASSDIVFGYLGELNHGFYAAIVAPLFVFFSLEFLRNGGLALRTLASGRRLAVTKPGQGTVVEDPLAILGARNERIFRVLAPSLVAVALVGVFGTEFSSRDRRQLGWVQADVVHAIGKQIDASGPLPISTLEAPPWVAMCRNDVGTPVDGCEVRIERIGGGASPENATAFGVFLVWALAGQALFLAFVGWIVCKIIFLFVTLFEAFTDDGAEEQDSGIERWIRSLQKRLRATRELCLRIRLDYEDPEERFGLGDFDRVYVGALLVLICGCLGAALGFPSNLAKGTSSIVPGGPKDWTLYGQVIIPVAATLGVALITTIPALVLLKMATAGRWRRIEHLATKIADAEEGGCPPGDVAKLKQRQAIVRRQTAWPQHRHSFWPLLAATMLLFALGVGTPLLALFDAVDLGALTRLSQRASTALCPLR